MLLDVNDDCLLEIFSYFNIADLYSSSKVCQRFLNIAIQAAMFPLINFSDPIQMGDCYRTITKTAPLREILPIFGPNLTTLSLNRRDFSIQCPRIFDAIAEHCKKLETLILNDCIISKPHKLFHQIDKLALGNCEFENRPHELRLAFESFSNLTGFTIIYGRNDGNGIDIFKRQTSVSTFGGYYLLERLVNLKELYIIRGAVFTYEYCSLSETIRALGAKNMLELIYIDIAYTYPNNSNTDLFESILCCKRLNDLAIRRLALNDQELNRFATGLPHLSSFLIFETSGVSSIGLTNFVNNCATLVHLYLNGDIINDDETIMDIFVIRQRMNVPLIIHLGAVSFQKIQRFNLVAFNEFVKFEMHNF